MRRRQLTTADVPGLILLGGAIGTVLPIECSAAAELACDVYADPHRRSALRMLIAAMIHRGELSESVATRALDHMLARLTYATEVAS